MALKILAVKLRAIGDTVIWTSALQTLRAAHPGAEIHTLTYASNRAVLEGHTAVDQQHYLEGRSRLELVKMLWRLRASRFAWLLGFHATTSLCRWAWLSGAQHLVLHHHSRRETPRGSLVVPHAGRLEDAIARDHRVLEAMGITASPAPTKICLSEAERARGRAFVESAVRHAGGNDTLPVHAFLPGAGHHLRRYPKDLWLPLATVVRAAGEYQPLVLVDYALSRELGLAADCARLRLPLLDQGSLRDFMVLLAQASRALANDSGPGHMAVALGVPTTFVFGPGCVGDWHPYDSTKNPVRRIAVDCRLEGPRDKEKFQYCTVDVCSHHRCLRENRFTV